MNTDASFRKNQEQLESETEAFIKNFSLNKPSSGPKIIPVVFHVIHTGGAGNISSAQIMDQVAILNEEFLRMQADTVFTPAAFKSVASPYNVEFRLATIDPSGNCTNGINRIYSNLAMCSVNNNAVKALSYWPSNKYLNIWLVESMHYSGNTSCVGGGYATFPGGAATLDGINIRGDLIGSIGTAATNGSWGNFLGRYLIHELGHWFNLRHIWGDANCGNDFVSDTPPHVTSNSGCPSFPHNSNNSCGGNSNGEMYTDYMDYTNGPCLNMFTAGQVARMDAAMNSSVSGRNNLYTVANLNATGTNDPYTYPVNCTANPDILPYGSIVVCVGDSVQFTDYSYGGNEISRSWDFAGHPATSLTDSIVKVKYVLPGTYTVGLSVTGSSGTKTKTFMQKVTVLDNNANPNYVAPFTDSFENPVDFANDWVQVNIDNDTTWRRHTTTYYTGSACVGIKNSQNEAPLTDVLISPAYNLTAFSTATLSFQLHFAAKTATDYDKLTIFISSDCGKTWQLKYVRLGSSNLKTVTPYYTSSHIPPPASAEWRLDKINLVNNWGANPVRFKFEFKSGGGNNIFIDDINITATPTSLSELVRSESLNVYPNPAHEILNINMDGTTSSKIELSLEDISGRIVVASHEIISQGNNTLQLKTQGLSEGVYILRIKESQGFIHSKKIIISN
jgi:PKD repeat protein